LVTDADGPRMSEPSDDRTHVLVPMDGSPQSEEALEYALGLPDAAITVLTVVNPFDVDSETPGYQSPVGQAGMPGYSEEWYDAVRDAIAERHERARERAEAADVPFSSEIVFGGPARRIVAYATDHDVDQIVLGTHGRSLPSRVLLGSVAETVSRRAPVSVTIVR
jgi:nucleotide-binding universal stress UspA family protein